jgi:two-component system chemotaxis response regulator CheB
MESGACGPIKVLVVEDLLSMSLLLKTTLNADPEIRVVGVAYNGREAVELAAKLKPDLITMDIHMPVMDGFEATKQIMAYHPTPILIVSASVFSEGMELVFKAISYGALDVIEKKEMVVDKDKISGGQLIEKVKFLSRIRVVHHPLAKLEAKPGGPLRVPEMPRAKPSERIVAIAASTGGPPAIAEILKKFPKDFPCPIVLVQHIASGFEIGLASWLDHECPVRVKVAEHSEEIRPGVVYIAPCDLQMRVGADRRICLSQEDACDGQIPSATVLLQSVAKAYGERAIGIVLTGMGCDGAAGLKAIRDACGHTIAQDEKSCVVFGMPKAAVEIGAAADVVPLDQIAAYVIKALIATA